MVKVDFKRDYYADLGLPPGADIDEVKKQFRKLGRLLILLPVGLGSPPSLTGASKRSNGTPTEIPARKTRRRRSSSSSRPPTKS